MNTCRKCSATESSEIPIAICDMCSISLCKACANLTSTEVRAVALKNRSIIFLCCDCRAKRDFRCDQTEMKELMLECFRNELASFSQNFSDRIVAEFEARLGLVSGEVTILRESNIELVNLLTNQPCQLYPKQCSSISSMPSCGGSDAELSKRTSSRNAKSTLPGKPSNPLKSLAPSANTLSAGAPKSTTVLSPDTDMRKPTQPLSSPLPRSVAPDAMSSSRRYANAAVVGSRKLQNSKITAACIRRRTSIFVGRLDNQVTSEDLDLYLRSTFGKDLDYKIEEQTVRTRDYKAYRVEADLELIDELLSPSNWPENVLIKKFRFFRPRPSTPNK